jgi:predicted Ser/Thr protein kinase
MTSFAPPPSDLPRPSGAPASTPAADPAALLALGLATQTDTAKADSSVPLPSPSELAVEFPQLEIIELLGRGGMGAVYKARQRDLDRLVALKILRPGLDADPGFAERFTREARALAQLNHPGIVTLYEFGKTSAGRYFILMEFVDGVNLRQLLDAGRLAPREALAIVPPLCDALQYAHDRGLIHRDIKPENILVDRLGRVKIADFGIARLAAEGRGGPPGRPSEKTDHTITLTSAGETMGTPAYMAPEQRDRPAEVDHRADLYALGVVFYQMLTGELPSAGQLRAPSTRVHLDVRLDEIVLRALEKDPDRRYSAASEFKTQVETVAHTSTTPPVQPHPSSRLSLDYRSPIMIFGLPLLHVTSGIDPATGRQRVARGIVAVGGIAHGVVACGGLAIGGFAFGGLSLGVFSYGGLAAGALAIGGIGVGLVGAFAGVAVAPVAIGGHAIGHYAYGGAGWGNHVCSPLRNDPTAVEFFGTWIQKFLPAANVATVSLMLFCVVLSFSVSWWARSRKPVLTRTRESNTRPVSQHSKAFHRAVPWALLCAVVAGLLIFSTIVTIKPESDQSASIPTNAAGHETAKQSAQVFRPTTPDSSYEVGQPIQPGTPPTTKSTNASAVSAEDQRALRLDRAGDTMQTIVQRLREEHSLRLSFENLDFTIADAVTLGARLSELTGKETKGLLTDSEVDQLRSARRLRDQEKLGSNTLIDLGARYTGQIEGDTVPAFFEKLTAGTPYRAHKLGATWLIHPRGESRLAFPVTLKTAGMTVSEVIGAIVKQAPSDRPIAAGMVFAMPSSVGVDPTPWLSVQAPELEFDHTPAFEALCKLGEAAHPGSVWELAGYRESRMLSTTPAPGDEVRSVVNTTQAWLGGIDREGYATAWRDASEILRSAITEEKFSAAMLAVRAPLGKANIRRLRSATPLTQLPGVPDGRYILLQFETSFDSAPAAIETVTFVRDPDGKWRAAGYYINPALALSASTAAANPSQTPAHSTAHAQEAHSRSAKEKEAVTNAQSWLADIDAGRFAQSWDHASKSFRFSITREQWNASLAAVRAPLGSVVTRLIDNTFATKRLPGVPDGNYMVMTFKTVFENKRTAVETVTFQEETDGGWRACGYFIK